MKNTILLDQYSLSELGSDRGLGRYAAMMAAGASVLPDFALAELIRTKSNLKIPDILNIQRDIWKLRLDKTVPYHSTSVYHLPVLKDRPWICSIQDVIPLDLHDYRKLGIKSRLLFANAKRSDLILANSNYTKSRIILRLGMSSARIMTCALPISASFGTSISDTTRSKIDNLLDAADVDSQGSYVVALADLRTPDPRKRYHWIDEIAEALLECGISMVVTGRGLRQEVFPSSKVIPSLTDEELSALYSGAVATYYPTAYEGQGLPPQEAMASGCPVIAYRNSSVEEVVKSPNFLLEDPVPWERQSLSASLPQAARKEAVARIQSWVDSEELLLNMRGEAQELAAKYSWTSFSKNLDALYSVYFEGDLP